MAVGDRQKLMISIMEIILNKKAETNKKFDWLINKHLVENFGEYFDLITRIFVKLNGNNEGMLSKKVRSLSPDCYFGETQNFIFEFDELQHFTEYKKNVLELYPKDIMYGFDVAKYIEYCNIYSIEALKKGPAGYRKPKIEFPYENGRAAQRAFFDAFRDLLPTKYGLKPTLRISEFEVKEVKGLDPNSIKVVENILKLRNVI